MRLKKKLRITGFSLKRGLEAGGLELKFDEDILKKYDIKPSTNLVGKELIVTLTSKEGGRYYDMKEGELKIGEIKKVDVEQRSYQMEEINHDKIYSITFNSNFPSYPHLNFRINDEEYKKLKKVPLKTLFKVSFKIN